MKFPTEYASARKGFILCVGMVCGLGAVQAATIDLAKPAGDPGNLASISGIYWRLDSTYVDDTFTKTADSSGNGYNGTLDQLNGAALPSLVTGVNVSGASGYSNGLKVEGTGTLGNPRVLLTLPAVNNLDMEATDFTGGMWVKMDEIDTGNDQMIVLMDRGGMNTHGYGPDGGHWSFFLNKDTSDNWQFGFQTGNGSTYQNGYHNASFENLSLQDGAWHHIGFNLDYISSGNSTVTFWLDGVSIGSASFTVDIMKGSADIFVRRFGIGERTTSTYYTSNFTGVFDDVFVTTGLHDFQAIPEPAALGLVILGAGYMIGKRRRIRGCIKN